MFRKSSSERGQAIALFAIALSVIVIGVGVVVDGGYAFAQRRQSQNAADFAAMAGTRIIGAKRTKNPPGAGTAANVENAIKSVLAANKAQLISAEYVDQTGLALGNVEGATEIPGKAFGVVVDAKTSWKPYLLGIAGVLDWGASSKATAFTTGESLGGGVLPIGIHQDTYDDLTECEVTNLDDCINDNLTSGHLNIPGGFGWLKFGILGGGQKCPWTDSLGMTPSGCDSSKVFLDSQIGPPSNSHGCCTEVGNQPPSADRIGSLTGNEWGDLSWYTDNRVPIWVPIWSTAGGNGAGAYYDIVGFGAIVLTGDNEHAKWLEGAAVSDQCEPGTEIEFHDYCTAPGADFIIDATGAVQLIR